MAGHLLSVFKTIHNTPFFQECNFLKKWVDFNTERRNFCSRNNDLIGKDFFKLMVNSVFGQYLTFVKS